MGFSMESSTANKRFKSASGAPINATNPSRSSEMTGAAALPAYQPPSATALIPPPRDGGRSAGYTSRSTASVSRPGDGNKLRLTVKAPPSKLRQAISGSRLSSASDEQSESDATPRPVLRSVRSTRNTRTLVDPDSDEIDDMADEDEAALGPPYSQQDRKLELMDSEIDAEGEQEDEDDEDEDEDEDDEDDEDEEEDEDEDMDELQGTPPSIAPIVRRDAKGRPNFNAASLAKGPLKSVEDKEMGDVDEDDDELSELDSNDEHANGGVLDTRRNRAAGQEGDDDEDDSDEDMDNSRSATPDLSKLTRRQRGAYEEDVDSGLLALSNEAQKKKVFTEEEHAVRRQEMARRRKNLSEKRNEEEKMETINKLLKKPAPKRRTRAEILAAQHAAEMGGTPGAEDGEEEPPNPVFARWVADAGGGRVGIPREWIQGQAGAAFVRTPNDEDTIKVSHRAMPYSGLLVEEVS